MKKSTWVSAVPAFAVWALIVSMSAAVDADVEIPPDHPDCQSSVG